MSSGGASDGSSGSKRLLLCRCDGEFGNEVYVARGLSIGRAQDNTFVIDDPAVSRHHCQVEWDGQGGLILRCVDPGAVLEYEGRHVSELRLQAGQRFRVGPAEFECRSAGREAEAGPRWLSKCPYCQSPQLPPPAPAVQACPACGNSILVFQVKQSGAVVCVAGQCGPLRLERWVGEGGMSVVFQGRVIKTDEPVAVKLLHPHLRNDPDAVRRFEREISELRKLRHPRLVRIVGFGKWWGYPALVTEWLPGGSLQTVIQQQRGSLCPFPQALVWLRQACEGLRAIHEAGLVHRDIKPSNLLLTGEGAIKIADLGLARHVGAETRGLTVTGMAVGSPHYMAPEQWDRPGTVDGRADIYALGVTFYELLTGRRPIGSWQPASCVNPTVPKEFDEILKRMLAPAVEERFTNVRQLQEAIEWTFSLRPPPLPPNRDRERSKVWTTLFVLFVALGVLSVLIGGAWLAKVLWEGAGTRPVDPGVFVTTQGASLRAAFSPDGQRIVTASGDGTVKVWDATTGKKLLDLKGHTGPVLSAAFSPDGQRIVTASVDKTAKVWDATTGKKLLDLQGHTGWVLSAAFSPDGQRIVTASYDDGTAIVWDATTGKMLQDLKGHNYSVWSAAFSPDGQRIVTASYDDGTAKVWDATTGQKLQDLQGHTGGVCSAAFSPDGQRIVTASVDKTAKVWDATTGKKLLDLQGHTGWVLSAAFSPDGQRIVTASYDDGTAIVWDATAGKKLHVLQGHTHWVRSAAFSPDGRRIVTASYDDGTAKVWDATTGQKLQTLKTEE